LQASIVDEGEASFFNKIKKNLSSKEQTFEQLRKARSDLGAAAEKAGMSDPNKARLIKSLKESVEMDMDELATKAGKPELKKAYKEATDYYKKEVIPYKDKALVKALKTANPDEIYSKFISRGKGDRAKNFYNLLDDKGKSAVRYGMIENAMNDAINETKGTFSPARFAQYFDKMQKPYDKIFTGKAKWEMDGFKKLMRAGERFGQFAENPPTGARLIPTAVASGAVGAIFSPALLKVMVAGGTLSAGLKAMTTTASGKKFLLAASELDPNSKGMEKLLLETSKFLEKELRKVTAQTGRTVVSNEN